PVELARQDLSGDDQGSCRARRDGLRGPLVDDHEIVDAVPEGAYLIDHVLVSEDLLCLVARDIRVDAALARRPALAPDRLAHELRLSARVVRAAEGVSAPRDDGLIC